LKRIRSRIGENDERRKRERGKREESKENGERCEEIIGNE